MILFRRLLRLTLRFETDAASFAPNLIVRNAIPQPDAFGQLLAVDPRHVTAGCDVMPGHLLVLMR